MLRIYAHFFKFTFFLLMILSTSFYFFSSCHWSLKVCHNFAQIGVLKYLPAIVTIWTITIMNRNRYIIYINIFLVDSIFSNQNVTLKSVYICNHISNLWAYCKYFSISLTIHCNDHCKPCLLLCSKDLQ